MVGRFGVRAETLVSASEPGTSTAAVRAIKPTFLPFRPGSQNDLLNKNVKGIQR